MADDVQTQLAALTQSIDRLIQGQSVIADTQKLHTKILENLLRAATAPLPETDPVALELEILRKALVENSGSVNELVSALSDLPRQIGLEMAEVSRSALADLN